MTPYFSDISEFLGMHGYAAYVWPAWGLVLGVLVVQALGVRAERARVLGALRRERARQASQVEHEER